jgi:hypothetical protein
VKQRSFTVWVRSGLGPKGAFSLVRAIFVLAALLGLGAFGPVLAGTIEASLDRNPIGLNESFTLTFSATEEPDGDPDFQPLQADFEILHQGQNSQFSIVNGKSSRTIEWQLTLMAKRAGTLTVPSIAFGDDRSQPLAVTVTTGGSRRIESAGADIFLETEAEPKNPYVQAQTILTLRILSRVPVGEARLGTPEAADAVVEKLDNNREYFTTRNGVRYKVTEIRYAIFPQKSGRLTINPVQLEAQIPLGGRSPFDGFFARTRPERFQSDTVELDVRPIPSQFSGQHWLPAANLALEDSWARQPPEAVGGEPVTRTLTLRADGTTVGLLPELNPKARMASGDIKQYPDQPALNEEKRQEGVSSVRQEKTALIAGKAGTYRMPSIEVPWWNTTTDRMETARIPERVLKVLPGTATPEPEKQSPQPESPAVSAPVPAPAARHAPPAASAGPEQTVWFWLTVAFGTGWIGTALAWWWNRKPALTAKQAVPPKQPDTSSKRQAREALERACKTGDPATARTALAVWADLHWPGRGLEPLTQAAQGDLTRQLALLDRVLYGQGETQWDGVGLWASFRDFESTIPKPVKGVNQLTLEPLYKS